MNEIFSKEEQVAAIAEKLLQSHVFSSAEDEKNYRFLLTEYKTLLKQMIKVVKLSDLIQLELKTMSEKLERVSQIDSLTEIYNKRYFNEAYLREWSSAVRSTCPLALLMIDIDYFKKYNDTYGHLQGDECLKTVAAEIQHSVNRPRDILARFGGEEFIVLLPETGIKGAAYMAQKVIDNIEKLAIEHAGSVSNRKVTVSIGVAAAHPKDGDNMDILLKQADHALYAAKKEGRNCFREYDLSQDTGY